MTFINTLVVGSSYDGPEGTPILPTDISDLEMTFGWQIEEFPTISAITSSGSTEFPIWGGQFAIYKKVGSTLLSDPLYNLTVTPGTNQYLFSNIGVSGTYVVKYTKIPDNDNLVWATEHILDQGADMPYVYRIPGSKAFVTIGDLTLTAQYSGTKYNNISIIVTGGILTIYWTLDYNTTGYVSYNLNQNITYLLENITNDCYYNKHPLFASCSILSPSIPNGTYLTTGGTIGSINPDTMLDLLNNIDFDNVGIVLIAGNPSTGSIATALNYIYNLGDIIGSGCIVTSTPISTYSLSASDYQNFLNLLPFKSQNLFIIPGWGTSTTSLVNPTWFPLSHTFAGLWSTFSSAPTNKPTTLNNISPVWTTDQLHSLGNQYCVFNNYIINGYSPWRACPTNGENPLINKVKMDITSRLEASLETIIGTPSLSVSSINTMVSNALSGIENVRDIVYNCTVDLYTVRIQVNVIPYGELQDIEINLVSTLPSSGAS